MFDIFRRIVNTYSVDNRSSRGELTDAIMYTAVPFAELPDLCSPVQTREDASPNFAYLVLRNGHSPLGTADSRLRPCPHENRYFSKPVFLCGLAVHPHLNAISGHKKITIFSGF